ncbi:MAG: hypothetical protein IKT37_02805 [Clostridia bacterium]|nr:hypothetical protein [Clostridia bacterium]
MINLNKAQFTPGVIAISALFIPALISVAVYLFFDFSVDFLVGLLISLCVYLCILLLFWIYSNSQDRMLILKEECLQVINPKVVNGVDCYEVRYTDIISFEHYRITSVKSWLMIFFNVMPRYTSVNFLVNGETVSKPVGYLRLNDIRKIASDHNIKLIEH